MNNWAHFTVNFFWKSQFWKYWYLKTPKFRPEINWPLPYCIVDIVFQNLHKHMQRKNEPQCPLCTLTYLLHSIRSYCKFMYWHILWPFLSIMKEVVVVVGGDMYFYCVLYELLHQSLQLLLLHTTTIILNFSPFFSKLMKTFSGSNNFLIRNLTIA